MKPFIADCHTHTILSGHAFGTIRELAAEAADKVETVAMKISDKMGQKYMM